MKRSKTFLNMKIVSSMTGIVMAFVLEGGGV